MAPMSVDDRITIPGLTDEGPSPSPPLVLPARQADRHGDAPCRAPDLLGLPALEAYAAADSAGVRLSVSVWKTTVGPWGMVVDQRPEAGTRVRHGGRLRVVVSGRPHAPVPEVRGMALEAAIERLCWLGFVPLVRARSTSSDMPAGRIVSTSPPEGTALTYGSVVALAVARPAEKGPSPVGRARSSGE